MAAWAIVLFAIHPRRVEAAEGRTSSLSWLRMPGADACIATQPLARAVEDRLGRQVFVSAAQADLSVEGRIEKRKTGWHAVITMRDPKGALLGTRELDRPDASCDAMSEPLALVIAVMIDPDAAMRPREEPPAPAPSPAPTPAPAPAPTPAPTPAPARDEPAPSPPKTTKTDPWRFEGGGHFAMMAGFAPQLAWGAGVDGILYPPSLPLGFRGTTTLFLPTAADGNGKHVLFDMLLFGGSLCPTIRGQVVNVMGCLGGQLGILRAREGDVIPIWNATAEARLSLHVAQPIMLGAGAGVALPILRPRYQDIYESSVVAFMSDVMIGLFFP